MNILHNNVCGCLSFKKDQRHVISTNPPLLGSANPFSISLLKCFFFSHLGKGGVKKIEKMGFCTFPDHFILFVD